MPVVRLELQPVGVRFLRQGEASREAGDPREVLSYCEAVRLAGAGEELLLRRESITSCRWSPVVLGLKEAESAFERRQEPRLRGTSAVLVAPLSFFDAGGEKPDVVVIRAEPAAMRYLAFMAGKRNCALEHAEELDKSALGYLWDRRPDWRVRFTAAVNRALTPPQRWAWSRKLAAAAFRREAVSDLFDRSASRSTVLMSICRNSTVIPHASGCANVSFLCSGGILWGGNRPDHMTSGWPYPIFEELRKRVVLTW